MELKYTIKESDLYKTVKEVLKCEFKISDRLLLKLKRTSKIFLNGDQTYPYVLINIGDTISILIDNDEENSNIVPTKMDLDIIYEDNCFLVINKPAGISTHPSILHYTDSLSNGVRYYFDSIGLHKKIRPINRLDKNTSGLILFAKNEYIQNNFVQQMQSGDFVKEYLTIVNGILEKKSGTINMPISRKENSIIERIVSSSGETAITEYKVQEEKNNMSLILCRLKTGRTHQIRVHMKAIGHPVVGDFLYGSESPLIDRQALHSYHIKAIHPVTKQTLEYFCSLPDDMENLLNK